MWLNIYHRKWWYVDRTFTIQGSGGLLTVVVVCCHILRGKGRGDVVIGRWGVQWTCGMRNYRLRAWWWTGVAAGGWWTGSRATGGQSRSGVPMV